MYKPEQDRLVLKLGGTDRITFLQNLVTNNITAETDICYTALLTPQGKYIADFFVVAQNDHLFIDVAKSHGPNLFKRLSMYRLRADVTIEETDLDVTCGFDDKPDNGFADPRHAQLGWRAYGHHNRLTEFDWAALRVDLCIPETGQELTPDSYVIEQRFEDLNGIDFKKGCYVGQEVMARMKHKTTLRKGLAIVELEGVAQPESEVIQGKKKIGKLHTISGNAAIAYLRFEQFQDGATAGQATLTRRH